MENNITCGGQLIRTVKWSMYSCRLNVMDLLQNASSGVYYEVYGGEPRKIVTDKLRSYGVAHRELIPETMHSTEQYENNRGEQSHEATRVRERGMRKFKSVGQAQRFLGVHAAVQNLFNLGRHLVRAQHYRNLRVGAFAKWRRAFA
jgi:putative transposase